MDRKSVRGGFGGKNREGREKAGRKSVLVKGETSLGRLNAVSPPATRRGQLGPTRGSQRGCSNPRYVFGGAKNELASAEAPKRQQNLDMTAAIGAV